MKKRTTTATARTTTTVNKVADMEVDKVTDMEVDKVVDMKVDGVGGLGSRVGGLRLGVRTGLGGSGRAA